MDDFSKAKTAFAAGFLALLLTGQSALVQHFGRSLDIFGLAVTLGQVFWATTGMLAVSVYATGLRLVTERSWPKTEWLANASYAVAVTIPPTTVAVVAISAMAKWLLATPAAASAVTSLVGVVAGAISIVVATSLSKRLRTQTATAVVKMLEQEESSQFRRAEALFRQGYFDLAVIDAYRSLESTIRRKLASERKLPLAPRIRGPLTGALLSNAIPSDLIQEFEFVRSRRNLASHSIEPISRADAERVLASTARLLARIAPDEDSGPDVA